MCPHQVEPCKNTALLGFSKYAVSIKTVVRKRPFCIKHVFR